MSEQSSSQPQRGYPGLTGAVLLIAVGVVFLLSNTGVLQVNWLDMARYWPVILILIGIDILLGRRSFFGSLAAAAIAVLVIGGLIWFTTLRPGALVPTGDVVTRDITQELGDAEALEVTLNLGVTETDLSALPGDGLAVDGEYRTNSDIEMQVEYSMRGDTGVLVISQEEDGEDFSFGSDYIGELNLGLTDDVPVDLIVNAGVGQATLDLSGIQLRSLTINSGVGSMRVILPGEGDYEVDIDSGVGSVKVVVPQSLEARVEVDSGLGSFSAPGRYEKVEDGLWITSGYSGAENRVLIVVDSGVGSVDIDE